MIERLKFLRKKLGLNQTEFGGKIGLKTSSYSDIENKRANLTDRNVSLICNAFNVSENWLRFGEGDVFNPIPREDEFTALLSEIEESDDEFIKTLIKTFTTEYRKLSEENKKIIRDFGYALAKKQKE